jgi:1-acyl-sn-glycerol-3-phosphate acyltransferase
MLAALLATLARIISGATAAWVDCLPEPRQRVYCANHTSHMDFEGLWSVLPDELRAHTRPVAAKEYWMKDRIRAFLANSVFRAVLVDRQATTLEERQRQVELMKEGLGDRDSLIIFPEGTRGEGESVAPFKSGLYHLARQAPRAELVPVYLENLNRVLPKGEFLPVPLLTRVFFGPPLKLGENEDKNAFLVRAREALVALGNIYE